jgi:hypothetical protein
MGETGRYWVVVFSKPHYIDAYRMVYVFPDARCELIGDPAESANASATAPQ